jgi:hypothetical protein
VGNLSLTEKKSIQRFGLIAFVLFGLLFSLGLWRGKILPIILFGILGTLGLGFICLPETLSPVYNKWLKISHFLGRMVTTFFLVLLYYLVITPAALIKRVLGGRPIPMKIDKNTKTYWVNRQEPAQSKERFGKRF